MQLQTNRLRKRPTNCRGEVLGTSDSYLDGTELKSVHLTFQLCIIVSTSKRCLVAAALDNRILKCRKLNF